eukprot:CAMPEP_0170338510 /NCGR_PEP_ID=MMETSP0116_2-20130129/70302_1 /TAXON_ID=400756 /ORGANISM="Durinskia baltica, Strain CSIRO CS-38" /LENGTH=159 /DNA_ID=CAMNT_0010591907 /DNA_START=1 /DNA_END=477 /DNA_ORIENTATION=-
MKSSLNPNYGVMSTPSALKAHTDKLLVSCRKLSEADMKKLMSVSDSIAKMDVQRYKEWDRTPCKAACLLMDGPAYQGFDGMTLNPEERKIAQNKVRILSGLYGVLKPFDAIANQLRKDAKVLVNAASHEYWKSVKASALGDLPVVTVDFPGPSVFAKRA